MSGRIYLPVLHSFENNNVFTGSFGPFRYKITPNVVMRNAKEVNNEQSSMKAEYWHGPLCYEYSDIEGEKTFVMTEPGLSQMRDWLDAQI